MLLVPTWCFLPCLLYSPNKLPLHPQERNNTQNTNIFLRCLKLKEDRPIELTMKHFITGYISLNITKGT